MGKDIDLYKFIETLGDARGEIKEALLPSDSYATCIQVGDERLPDDVNDRFIALGYQEGDYVTVLIQ